MSSTRHAEQNAPFRQERFASSAEFERGLMGNLVARRAAILESPEDRELVWFLQLLSHAPGGLNKVALEILAADYCQLGSESMLKYGFKPGQIYREEQTLEARRELDAERKFRLKNEVVLEPFLGDCEIGAEARAAIKREHENERNATPMEYPASAFIEHCREKSAWLAKDLAMICLDPSQWRPGYFHALPECLAKYMAAQIEARRTSQVITALGKQVHSALDYSLQSRSMVLIDGLARTGKTHAVKDWCNLHPGRARYVQVPSTNDDIGFFRAIAKSLGVSINANSKAQELRTRIEDTLQPGDLMLVFDEAHYLWPQGNFREKMPGRISWIMTALVNNSVPVALVTTPQFFKTQKTMERNSAWTSEQFTGRIGHYEKLPDNLSATDLESIARSLVPGGCAKSIETLVVYAQSSTKYLAGIVLAVRRAQFLANQAGREKIVFADVKAAIQGSVIPSDSAMVEALKEPAPTGRGRAVPPRLPAREAALLDPRDTMATGAPAVGPGRAGPAQPVRVGARVTTPATKDFPLNQRSKSHLENVGLMET